MKQCGADYKNLRELIERVVWREMSRHTQWSTVSYEQRNTFLGGLPDQKSFETAMVTNEIMEIIVANPLKRGWFR